MRRKLHFGFEAYRRRIRLRLLCVSDLRDAVLACRPFPERMGPEPQSLVIVKVKKITAQILTELSLRPLLASLCILPTTSSGVLIPLTLRPL